MSAASSKQRHYGITLLLGALSAVTFYALTAQYNTMDCQTLHLTVHSGGMYALGRILLAVTLGSMMGLPLALLAAGAGLLTSPLTGAALVSAGLVVSSMILFMSFRLCGPDHPLSKALQAVVAKRSWFSQLQDSHSPSGMQWAATQLTVVPFPVAWFAAYCGASVRQLSLLSLLSGAFIATTAVIISYAFAGSYVGCAVLDYQFGLSIDRYKVPMLLSIALIILLLKLRPRYVA